MRQHPIDLLPQSIRDRSQAGLRTGRYIAAVVVSLSLVLVATAHARLGLRRARGELVSTRAQANAVLQSEAEAGKLGGMIHDLRGYLIRYHDIVPPIHVSDVLATVINEMPEGMTLERLDVDAGQRRGTRSSRTRRIEIDDHREPRTLVAEISGFAPKDEDIAEYVGRLSDTGFAREVSLDFSRGRYVRERPAREFRLSFRMDLEATYEVVLVDPAPLASAGDE